MTLSITFQNLCMLVVLIALLDPTSIHNTLGVDAKKPSRPARAPPSSASRRSRPPPSNKRRPPPSSRYDEEDEDAYDDFDEEESPLGSYPPEDSEEEDYDAPPRRKPKAAAAAGKKRGPPPSARKQRPPPSGSRSRVRVEYEEEEDDCYEDEDDMGRRRPPSRSGGGGRRGPPPRRGGPPGGRGGKVVPYGRGGRRPQESAFTKGWNTFASYMPDPAAVKEGVTASISAARETTSTLSSNIYREVKGLTSSELEQVMLKATRPDDTPVKGKHVERLVGVTYQISARYDIYDAVLRKLWKKMAEDDWRTTIKALYILHRYSADGAPEHSPALKGRLRELRRTVDPKYKGKYFNTKQLMAGDKKPENDKYRNFLARYAKYVLLRAQCFGGVFDEISQKPAPPKGKKGKGGKAAAAAAPKPITSTNLRVDHLEAAKLLLRDGVACQLKDGEECENTAIACERVASDLIGLTTAVAIALNRALKHANDEDAGDDPLQGADPAVIQKWCEFYSEELLPQTRAMVKKTSPKLDAYGLFLPTRMGASLSQETLQTGLKAEELFGSAERAPAAGAEEEVDEEEEAPAKEEEKEVEEAVEVEEVVEEEREAATPAAKNEQQDEVEEDEYDEYEYEEEEYYDDEEA